MNAVSNAEADNAATYALLIDGMYSKTNHFNTIAYITYGATALLLRQP